MATSNNQQAIRQLNEQIKTIAAQCAANENLEPVSAYAITNATNTNIESLETAQKVLQNLIKISKKINPNSPFEADLQKIFPENDLECIEFVAKLAGVFTRTYYEENENKQNQAKIRITAKIRELAITCANQHIETDHTSILVDYDSYELDDTMAKAIIEALLVINGTNDTTTTLKDTFKKQGLISDHEEDETQNPIDSDFIFSLAKEFKKAYEREARKLERQATTTMPEPKWSIAPNTEVHDLLVNTLKPLPYLEAFQRQNTLKSFFQPISNKPELTPAEKLHKIKEVFLESDNQKIKVIFDHYMNELLANAIYDAPGLEASKKKGIIKHLLDNNIFLDPPIRGRLQAIKGDFLDDNECEAIAKALEAASKNMSTLKNYVHSIYDIIEQEVQKHIEQEIQIEMFQLIDNDTNLFNDRFFDSVEKASKMTNTSLKQQALQKIVVQTKKAGDKAFISIFETFKPEKQMAIFLNIKEKYDQKMAENIGQEKENEIPPPPPPPPSSTSNIQKPMLKPKAPKSNSEIAKPQIPFSAAELLQKGKNLKKIETEPQNIAPRIDPRNALLESLRLGQANLKNKKNSSTHSIDADKTLFLSEKKPQANTTTQTPKKPQPKQTEITGKLPKAIDKDSPDLHQIQLAVDNAITLYHQSQKNKNPYNQPQDVWTSEPISNDKIGVKRNGDLRFTAGLNTEAELTIGFVETVTLSDAKVAIRTCEPPLEINSANKQDVINLLQAAQEFNQLHLIVLTESTKNYLNDWKNQDGLAKFGLTENTFARLMHMTCDTINPKNNQGTSGFP